MIVYGVTTQMNSKTQFNVNKFSMFISITSSRFVLLQSSSYYPDEAIDRFQSILHHNCNTVGKEETHHYADRLFS